MTPASAGGCLKFSDRTGRKVRSEPSGFFVNFPHWIHCCRVTIMAKKIPDFESEAEEAAFWKTHDVRDYINWENADAFVKRVLKDRNASAEILKEMERLTDSE
jgi:hypothetical protein